MLKKEQKIILEEIFASPLAKTAAWGGGTALAEIYLGHRLSQDIDIILLDLPAALELTILTNRIKKKLQAKHKESIVSMNRFQYVFILKDNSQLKLEFIFYPFPKLGASKKVGKIKVESLKDIAVAKTLTAYQRIEVKDAYDLFIILKRKKFSLEQLVRGVEKKFGEKIDTAMLLSRLTNSLTNFSLLRPLLTSKKVTKEEMIVFFQKEFNKFLRKI